jgi:hypothetical protein
MKLELFSHFHGGRKLERVERESLGGVECFIIA